MTPAQFIARWKDNPLSERAGAQAHFDDLCDLLGVDKPRDSGHYCFERGAGKASGGDGWADVWKRGHFGWENKRPGRDLRAALKQLTDYSLELENPPLLVVCDRERIEIHTAFTGYPDRIVAKSGHEADLKKRTLTNLYNAIVAGKAAWLDNVHKALDAAVAAAYGWNDYTPEMSDDEILRRLLALNLARAAQSTGGKP